jgi:phosphinothricin acetyltransferase
MTLALRQARAADAPAIAAIYGYWVLHGTGTFEEAVPADAEMAARMAAIERAGLPWLVAEEAGRVIAYAYASPFRPRTGYRYTVEDSVYVAPQAQGRGLGALLLQEIVARSEALGVRQMLAVIGDSANAASIALHAAQGFVEAGVARSVGFKFGRWLDIVIMQRALGQGDAALPAPGEGWRP